MAQNDNPRLLTEALRNSASHLLADDADGFAWGALQGDAAETTSNWEAAWIDIGGEG